MILFCKRSHDKSEIGYLISDKICSYLKSSRSRILVSDKIAVLSKTVGFKNQICQIETQNPSKAV